MKLMKFRFVLLVVALIASLTPLIGCYQIETLFPLLPDPETDSSVPTVSDGDAVTDTDDNSGVDEPGSSS